MIQNKSCFTYIIFDQSNFIKMFLNRNNKKYKIYKKYIKFHNLYWLLINQKQWKNMYIFTNNKSILKRLKNLNKYLL